MQKMEFYTKKVFNTGVENKKYSEKKWTKKEDEEKKSLRPFGIFVE